MRCQLHTNGHEEIRRWDILLFWPDHLFWPKVWWGGPIGDKTCLVLSAWPLSIVIGLVPYCQFPGWLSIRELMFLPDMSASDRDP